MPGANAKATCCLLVSIVDENYSLEFDNSDKFPLVHNAGENLTEAEDIPDVRFYCTVDLEQKLFNLVVIEGRAYFNGYGVLLHELYQLQEGDILGFSNNVLHCYKVAFAVD